MTKYHFYAFCIPNDDIVCLTFCLLVFTLTTWASERPILLRLLICFSAPLHQHLFGNLFELFLWNLLEKEFSLTSRIAVYFFFLYYYYYCRLRKRKKTTRRMLLWKRNHQKWFGRGRKTPKQNWEQIKGILVMLPSILPRQLRWCLSCRWNSSADEWRSARRRSWILPFIRYWNVHLMMWSIFSSTTRRGSISCLIWDVWFRWNC